MKWGIAILLILGVVAAGSAAMLVGILGVKSSASSNNDSSPSNIEVAMAKVSMPSMTVVTLDHIVKEEIPKENMPEGKLLSPSQVIGKVLAVSVVEGQILTDSCFITEGTGSHLVANLPDGMRLVSLNLSTKSIPDALLLYPGCVVDVLVSFKLSSSDRNMGTAISTTMLRGIQVLVVEGNSVVSKPDAEGESTAKARRSGSQITVTVMVDSKQAEALQLATNNGSISLAIRNPLDKRMVDMEATVLSQGRLASLGSVLTPAVFTAAELKEQLLLIKQSLNSEDTLEQTQEDNNVEKDIIERQVISDEQYQVRQNPRWGITVIRGSETTIEELDIRQSNPVTTARTNK